MADNTVVPQSRALDEEEFHAAMMEAITAAVGRHGRAKVASVLGFNSVRQLGNIAAGSFPAPWRLYNLLSLGDDALDKIDRKYGRRGVPRDAVCSSDPISSRLAALLSRTIEMERPDSPGGPAVKLRELLMLDEAELRHCAHTLAGWVELIDAYRCGEAPKLKAVG